MVVTEGSRGRCDHSVVKKTLQLMGVYKLWRAQEILHLGGHQNYTAAKKYMIIIREDLTEM